MEGINLVVREGNKATELVQWYTGSTLVDLLGMYRRHLSIIPTTDLFADKLEPPARDLTSPLRLPISNVFKGQNSGISVSGRVCGGVIQVGERVRVLPGDETALIKCLSWFQPMIFLVLIFPFAAIEVEDESQPWAAAGSSVTLNLTSIDPAQVNIGTVLCPITETIPLATVFSAKIIVFDIQVPITAGTSVCIVACCVFFEN